ncbi:MAG TPA: hypothetical protein VGO56_01095 [Pyrinomonadaceae bacterium]|jgi:hypothetical protein|nr:hypothetical protein [Pyrinomonadaceae bacterium]
MADGGDSSGSIIIKGGSVELSFDGTLYLKESGTAGPHKHATRKITRIQVDDESGKSQFDSGTNDEGLKWTIKVSTSA